jgi:hypothetical protein
MIIDAFELKPNTVLRSRYCIIGSGMGGAAVAQTLAAAGEDVLLIEAGGVKSSPDGGMVHAEHVGRPFNIPISRCIELGGTSNQWHGICAPLDEIDFQARPWIEGSGWPITRSDLAPYYSEASRFLGLPSDGLIDLEPFKARYKAELTNIAFDEGSMRHKLDYFRRRPVRWKSPLYRLARKGTIRCVLHSPALELVSHGSGDKIDELIIGCGAGTARVRAEVFVICCGGLETPRLLLNSRNGSPRALGNEYDQVGRNLLDHPAGHFCKIRFHRPIRAQIYSGMPLTTTVALMAGLMFSNEEQRRLGLANHYVWLRPSVSAARIDDELMLSFLKARNVLDLSVRQIKAIVTEPDIMYRVLVHRFGVRPKYRYGDLWFMTEQLPNPESRVTLSDQRRDRYGYPIARVNWQLSTRDLEGFANFARRLFEVGLRSDRYALARVDDFEVWERTVASAAHHLGTARMADSPRRGVVDRDLRIFGVTNSYICDGSVFATAGSVNPSLTITALGIRLGKHLLALRAKDNQVSLRSTNPANEPSGLAAKAEIIP